MLFHIVLKVLTETPDWNISILSFYSWFHFHYTEQEDILNTKVYFDGNGEILFKISEILIYADRNLRNVKEPFIVHTNPNKPKCNHQVYKLYQNVSNISVWSASKRGCHFQQLYNSKH